MPWEIRKMGEQCASIVTTGNDWLSISDCVTKSALKNLWRKVNGKRGRKSHICDYLYEADYSGLWILYFWKKLKKKQKNDLTSLNPLVPRPATVAVLRHWTSIMIVLDDIGYLYQALKSIKNRKRLSIKNCQKPWKPEIINWKPEIIYSASTLILRPFILRASSLPGILRGF